MTQIPSAVRDEVITAVYADCDRLEWETLTKAKKSEAYTNWISDPRIGGELRKYMAQDRIRVWLKDGPLKEYMRAVNGVGPYASYTTRRAGGADALVTQAFGTEWSVIEGSFADKPLRCKVANGADIQYLTWAPYDGLRDLAWWVVNLRATSPSNKATVAIVRAPGEVLAKDERKRAEAICGLIGADVRFLVQTVTRRPAGTSEDVGADAPADTVGADQPNHGGAQ